MSKIICSCKIVDGWCVNFKENARMNAALLHATMLCHYHWIDLFNEEMKNDIDLSLATAVVEVAAIKPLENSGSCHQLWWHWWQCQWQKQCLLAISKHSGAGFICCGTVVTSGDNDGHSQLTTQAFSRIISYGSNSHQVVMQNQWQQSQSSSVAASGDNDAHSQAFITIINHKNDEGNTITRKLTSQVWQFNGLNSKIVMA